MPYAFILSEGSRDFSHNNYSAYPDYVACRILGTEGLCRLIHRISYTLPKIIRVVTVDTETDGSETSGVQASISYFPNNLDENRDISYC